MNLRSKTTAWYTGRKNVLKHQQKRQKKQEPVILLAHGDGGVLTHDLITGLFLRYFDNKQLRSLTDAAVLTTETGRVAITTDSFVIDPLFFPGGDIGKLAVCGTVNDLAVSGAQPRYLTVALIIEEGFSLALLEKIVASMAATCLTCGVSIVAGDTKVVPRGHVDQLFINTTGFGFIPPSVSLGYQGIQPGDRILVNGNLGEHGLAVLAAREKLGFSSLPASDCAPLNLLTGKLLAAFSGIKFMRDLTRGGLATTLKEVALSTGLDCYLEEDCLPVDPAVWGATEMLGLDPLYLANEGKLVAVVKPEAARTVCEFMRDDPLGKNAGVVGEIRVGKGNVYLKTSIGGTRYLDLLAGDPLPRIC
jgi:hydrogenase expression/formation protein HypE